MAVKQLWVTDRFFGGISEAAKEGPKGAFLHGENLDLTTDLTALGVRVKTAEQSASTIVDLPKWIEHDAVNDNTYAYGDDGEWYKEASDSWTKQTTLTTAKGQGMKIWNDYVYFRKTSNLSRYGALSGTPSLTQAWQTSNVQTENDHGPIVEFLGNLYFANGRYLGEWDDSTWTYNKLTLPIGWKIRCMAVLGEELVMGGWIGSNVYDYDKGFLWFWNGTDESITNFLEINEGAVNSMHVIDNNLYFVTGARGKLYVYTGQVIPLRTMSLELDANDYIEVFPGAMDSHRGQLLVGMAGKTDATSLTQGIYSYGRPSKNYPRALNVDHIISTGSKTGITLKVGSVHSVGPNELYVGWEDTTSNNGIDKISGTTPYSSSTWHSLWFDNGNPYAIKELDFIKFTFKPLAANESMDFYYRLDRASTWGTKLGTVDTDGATEVFYPITPMKTFKEIQVRADLKTTGSTAPNMLSSSVSFSERRSLKGAI